MLVTYMSGLNNIWHVSPGRTKCLAGGRMVGKCGGSGSNSSRNLTDGILQLLRLNVNFPDQTNLQRAILSAPTAPPPLHLPPPSPFIHTSESSNIIYNLVPLVNNLSKGTVCYSSLPTTSCASARASNNTGYHSLDYPYTYTSGDQCYIPTASRNSLDVQLGCTPGAIEACDSSSYPGHITCLQESNCWLPNLVSTSERGDNCSNMVVPTVGVPVNNAKQKNGNVSCNTGKCVISKTSCDKPDPKVPNKVSTDCLHSVQVAPGKSLNAKEVEELLQNALWNTGQPKNSSFANSTESLSSGGCDTGYSSRCSTPPSSVHGGLPSPPPPTSAPSQEQQQVVNQQDKDQKQGTNVLVLRRHLEVPCNGQRQRESRSQSPGACSVSSQGSYRNPCHKRRYNNNGGNNHNYYNNTCNNSGGNGYKNYQYKGGNAPYINYTHNRSHPGEGPNNYFQGRKYEKGYIQNCHIDYNYRHGGSDYNNSYNRNRYHNNYRNHYNQSQHPSYIKNRNQSRNGGGNNHSDRDENSALCEDAGYFSIDNVPGEPWKSEVVGTPVDLLPGTEWDSLSKQVWDRFQTSQQTDRTFMKKFKLKDRIHKIVRNVFPTMCQLYVVGSSLSGFGSDTSDVDMCLMITPGDLDQKTEATAVLRLLQRELSHYTFIQKMELIRAKVPILKFRDYNTRVEVDLNCNNSVGIRNTHLLNSYSQLDWRVRPLVLVVKLWAQYHEINNAKDMTISSYSLVLMVIHFLQCGVSPPVLPCLQQVFPERFRSHTPMLNEPIIQPLPKFVSNNKDTLGQLFVGFFDYFANIFRFCEDTMSIRTGGTLPTQKCRFVKTRKNDSRMWKYLCIEEPFDLTNTARSVYDEEVFEHVKNVFTSSYTRISKDKDLNSILPEDLNPEKKIVHIKKPEKKTTE
ncbi:uncharacterized protein LOC143028620 isoform X3 [Oratosquilla oratoria]|uniref:uncharacterized protein LOC143028620 isoform X3 n=1 Tax=Oratosquilla oratoria TaxID=337810 RepID=UPI003F75AA22